MKLLKGDVGRLCLVKWDDIGRVESMLLEISNDRKYKEAKVFDFNSRVIHNIEWSQVVEKNGYVTPNSLLASRYERA